MRETRAVVLIRRWWRHRQEERLWRRHAKYVGEAIALIARTNPTLASVTAMKARDAVVYDPPPATVGEGRARLDACLDIVLDAVKTEERRLVGPTS